MPPIATVARHNGCSMRVADEMGSLVRVSCDFSENMADEILRTCGPVSGGADPIVWTAAGPFPLLCLASLHCEQLARCRASLRCWSWGVLLGKNHRSIGPSNSAAPGPPIGEVGLS